MILSTTAATDSPVGAYPIVASNATSANYAITFRDGTLAVARASSSTTMATPSAASMFGQAVTFTVQVGPGPNLATGSVNFLVNGIMAASVPVNSVTGLATWTTTSLGLGSHTISAAYTGNTDVLPSLSGAIQQAVSQANSQSGLTGHAVYNRRGQIVAVDLDASVLAGSPGSGIPTGPVTFFQGQRKLGKATLSGGMAELTVKPGLVLNKAVTVQYAGSTDFRSSTSPKVTITRKSITAVARPFAAFYTRSHRADREERRADGPPRVARSRQVTRPGGIARESRRRAEIAFRLKAGLQRKVEPAFVGVPPSGGPAGSDRVVGRAERRGSTPTDRNPSVADGRSGALRRSG